MSKAKLTPEQKVMIVESYLNGEISQNRASQIYDVAQASIRRWIQKYEAEGPEALQPPQEKRIYSDELKTQAVLDYLSGAGSLMDICKKYKIRDNRQLRRWIKRYNSGRGFGHSTSGGSRMSKARKTTQEERIAIAKECLENGKNYRETATRHNVSYQQVYTWVRRFSELGEAGLEDRRGKRTADQEPRTEMEEMRVKLAKLEHELYMTKMERDLLKKLNELERRDAFHK